ncbi:MAG: ABC transporter substrate-binding protein [Clostridiales bacterium]|jgi:iron complex transport system substrate-binding protein|nr:ABC transporter substrate-binding protein [Clostridiales bacterium]
MNRVKITLLPIALLLIGIIFAGCNKAPAPSPTAGPDSGITVVDMMGREVKLEAPATRVVALAAADCEILYALGAGDTLIGRGAYCDYPEQVLEVQAVESGSETNIEQIIALEPQVVIMSTMAQSSEQVQALERAGVKVIETNAHDINGTYEAIKLIGSVTGRDDEAEALVAEMKASFDELISKADPNSGKTIYFEVSPLQHDLWTAGSGTFMDEIANMLGLTNIFADVKDWGMISEEQVLERNPDYIVSTSMSYGAVEEIAGRKGWQDVTAVKNGKILNTYNNETTRPGPRLVDGARMIYELAYGD